MAQGAQQSPQYSAIQGSAGAKSVVAGCATGRPKAERDGWTAPASTANAPAAEIASVLMFGPFPWGYVSRRSLWAVDQPVSSTEHREGDRFHGPPDSLQKPANALGPTSTWR